MDKYLNKGTVTKYLTTDFDESLQTMKNRKFRQEFYGQWNKFKLKILDLVVEYLKSNWKTKIVVFPILSPGLFSEKIR